MKRFLTYLLSGLMLSAFLHACKVHEWPDPYKPVQVNLDLVFATELPLYQIVPATGRASTSIDDYDIRYQVWAYLLNENGDYDKENPAYKFTFSRDDVLKLDYSTQISIDQPGRYHLICWTDYVDQGSTDHKFYVTESFTTITLRGDSEAAHVGSNDFRDAFWGTTDIEIPKLEISEEVSIDATINMERPLAKFTFISTDLDQFVTRVLELRAEIARARAEEQAAAEGRAITDEELNNTEFETRVNLNDFRIVFTYTAWMPYIFNAHQNKPIYSHDPRTVQFDSKLVDLGNNEAELGFDYFMVNGKSTDTDVSMAVYDKDGTFITSQEVKKIPLTRSKLTIVKDKFLTAEADGGVGINPDFDGDHNWVVED